MSQSSKLQNLGLMAASARELEQRLAGAVAGARAEGASWAQIGASLGITRQAAQQKYGKKAGNNQLTGQETIEGAL